MVYSAIYISSYWCRVSPTSLPNNHQISSKLSQLPNMDYVDGKCKMDFGL
jgi:hypothetical protein